MTRRRILLLSAAGLAIAAAAGFGVGRLTTPSASTAPSAQAAGKQALYWYDPMYPAQKFEKPGKSPFMDMQLVPKYAGDASAQGGVQIDPTKTQNLGVRLATVELGTLSSKVSVPGVIEFNARDVAVVQARAAGFVQRVYGRAPGDIVGAGAPLADLLVPEWTGAQGEFLAVKRIGDPALIQAARQRLRLLGMPETLIVAVERSGRVRNSATVSTPIAGVIKSLSVRSGMTVSAGQTLAEVNGLDRVWLNAAVPEAMAGEVRVGQVASATLAAYPGEVFAGRVTAVLPQAQVDSRTLTIRIELPNSGERLRPGLFATVQLVGADRPALLVASEALIRTGRRTLVMVAGAGGRYLPAEVKTGREGGGRTEVLAGLFAGEKVVASGQFLLDSEASLSGVQARPVATATLRAAGAPLHESVGKVEQITPAEVTLSHEPVPAIGWPAMTMQFRLADPALGRGLKVGDRVTFAFEQTVAGPTVRRLSKAPAR